MRIVEYTPGYLADRWSQKAYVLLSIEGKLRAGLKDSRRAARSSPAWSCSVADESSASISYHRNQGPSSSSTERQDLGGALTTTIYGAGAIGGLAGACPPVRMEAVLVGDKVAEHVEAMNGHGLRITGAAELHRCPCALAAATSLRGPLGLTFLAVKSQDTDAALDVLAPLVGPDTVVVSLQNGMNPPRIAARIGANGWSPPSSTSRGLAGARTHRARRGGAIYLGEIDGRKHRRLRPDPGAPRPAS